MNRESAVGMREPASSRDCVVIGCLRPAPKGVAGWRLLRRLDGRHSKRKDFCNQNRIETSLRLGLNFTRVWWYHLRGTGVGSFPVRGDSIGVLSNLASKFTPRKASLQARHLFPCDNRNHSRQPASGTVAAPLSGFCTLGLSPVRGR